MASFIDNEKSPVPETQLPDSHQARKAEEASLPEGSNAGLQKKDESAAVAKDNNEEDEIDAVANHVHGIPMLILAFGLCVVVFLIGLDQMIIATAIPKITTQFNSIADVGWYGSAYLLTSCAFQPSYGKIYSYFNIKLSFVIALSIFELGSIICAAAPSSTVLIVGRAVAGMGAAGLFSGGMTIIGFAVPLRQRPLYIGALSSMFGVSSIVGPILGGVFVDRLTWRWCFWINLPFGGLAILSTYFFKSPIRKHTQIPLKQKLKELDFLGATFLISGIVCLLLALQWGGISYPWSSSRVWGCFIGFGLLIAVFLIIQFRLGDRATIPPRILKQRTIAATAATLNMLSMCLFTHVYFLPFWFQAAQGTTAEQSGIRTIPYLVSNTLFALGVGGIVTLVGYYTPFIIMGTILLTIGSGLLYTLKVNSSAAQYIGYQILAGGGSGAAMQLPFIATQVVLPPKDMPTGNAVAIFFNSLGGAIALSISSNIFTNELKKQIPIYAPGVNTLDVITAGSTQLAQVAPSLEVLNGLKEAYNAAISTTFILPIAAGGMSFFASLFFEWKSVKGKSLMGGAGAA